MASRKSTSFSINPNSVQKIGDAGLAYIAEFDKDLRARMGEAIEIVYRVAHQRRPMISNAQAKAEGRGYKTVINSKGKAVRKIKRVSDPDAEAGVPVDTGNLRANIKKEIKPGKIGKLVGRIYVEDVEYALAMEFGVPSKNIRARPFMRPAIDLSRVALKAVFSKNRHTKI